MCDCLFMSIVDPPSIVVSPQDVVLVEGQGLTLFCNASEYLTPNITWYKVGGSMVGRGDTYHIKNVSRGDEGSYRCVVNNEEECDTVRAVAKVTVQCKFACFQTIK